MAQVPRMLPILLFLVAQLLVSGYAGWRGGAPERVVAFVLLAAAAITLLIPRLATEYHLVVNPWLVTVDVVLLAMLVGVALFANRYWPLWLCTVHLLAVSAHGARAWDQSIWAGAYYIVTNYSAWIVIGLLAGGTWRHQRRLKAGLPEHPWSPLRSTGHDPRGQ